MTKKGRQLELNIPVTIFAYDLVDVNVADYNHYSQNTRTKSPQTGYAHYQVIEHIHAQTGIPRQDVQFTYTAYGKPQFQNIHFSISHTKQYLFISLAPFEHGIDFEHIDQSGLAQWKSIQKWCTANVRTSEEFYMLWTQIEAYVKYRGTGLIGIEKHQIMVMHSHNKWYINNIPVQTFPIYDGYISIVYEREKAMI